MFKSTAVIIDLDDLSVLTWASGGFFQFTTKSYMKCSPLFIYMTGCSMFILYISYFRPKITYLLGALVPFISRQIIADDKLWVLQLLIATGSVIGQKTFQRTERGDMCFYFQEMFYKFILLLSNSNSRFQFSHLTFPSFICISFLPCQSQFLKVPKKSTIFFIPQDTL